MIGLLVVVSGLVTIKTNVNANDTNSSHLIDKIRRQLMRDNYDYLSRESEEEPPKRVNEQWSPDTLVDDYDYHDHDKERFNITNILVPRARDPDQERDDEASKNDLMFYLNDDMIGLNDYEVEASDEGVKYRVMKVRSAHPSRRSLGVRRFIQERGQDGVALMSLDDGPFPDFKLPKSRRQYMQETSDDDDMENLVDDFSLEDY